MAYKPKLCEKPLAEVGEICKNRPKIDLIKSIEGCFNKDRQPHSCSARDFSHNLDDNLTVGVLALQGAFAKHQEMLQKIGVKSIQVVHPKQLSFCDGLILPGGESTTMIHLIQEMKLLKPLRQLARMIPFFGTCAGMILMARQGLLNLMDIDVVRNAYGKQSASFSTTLSLPFAPSAHVEGIFIRAPSISAIHSPHLKVLAKYNGEAVCVEQRHHLACAFHPELTNKGILHHYFIQLCMQAKQSLQQPSKTTRTKSFPTI